MKNNFFLLENNDYSPDGFEYNNIYFDWSDFDAVPFIYQTEQQKFYFLDYCGSHWDLKKDITAQQLGYNDYSDFYHSSSFTDKYDEFENELDKTCSNFISNTIEGRAWIKKNAIAFWGDSISKDIIQVIINNIENAFNCTLENPLIVFTNKIMHFDQYKADFNIDTDKEQELKAIHLMNQSEKRKKLSDFRKIRDEKNGKKLGNMTMAQYHNLIYQEQYLPKINENFEAEVHPSQVNLSSFKPKKVLNREIWDNNSLNSKIRLQILDIVDDFMNFSKMKWIKPIDIVLTGSICNYNWSKYSDIDVHIIIDISKLDHDASLLREYFNMKKNEWNNDHTHLKIYNFKIEIYVEDVNDFTISNGIYSLMKNKWIKKPTLYRTEMNDLEGEKLKIIASKIMTDIDDLNEIVKNNQDKVILNKCYERANKLFLLLKWKRNQGLQLNGEYSLDNILYKILRRTHYLDKLWKLKIFIYDKINSLK